MDFSLRAFRTWYKERLKRFLATGVSGLWNDLNEPAQNFMADAVHDFNSERRIDRDARNLYALNMASITDEAMREMRPDVRPWQISRSGYPGIQRFSANWSGDANSDWEALATNVQMTVSTGLSGQDFFGHDAGGFLGSPSPELFTRWLQFSLYTALFRNHAINEAERREPWVFPDPWRSVIKSTIEQRYRMLPLLYSLMESASRAVQPFVAPLSFWFPADENTFSRSLEYMLGNSLLVAPVVQEGTGDREVYLPGPGSWVDTQTGQTYLGGRTAVIPAPIEYIPVLAREGAIIPGGPLLQHTGEQAPPDLTFDIYPGRDNVFTLYEDDGVSMQWTRGDFLRTELRLTHGVDGIQLRKSRVAGNRAEPPRSWRLLCHRILGPPRSVALNGAALPLLSGTATQGWQYDADKRLLTAVIDDPGREFLFGIRP
jgi:alpha-glucosidase